MPWQLLLALVCMVLLGSVLSLITYLRKGGRQNLGLAVMGLVLAGCLLAQLVLQSF